MLKVKSRAVAHARLSISNNPEFSFSTNRKRMLQGDSENLGASEAETPQPSKKAKYTGIKNSEGIWNPKTSKFVKRGQSSTLEALSTPNASKPTNPTSTPADTKNVRKLSSVSSVESLSQPSPPAVGVAGRTGWEGNPPVIPNVQEESYCSGLSTRSSDLQFLIEASEIANAPEEISLNTVSSGDMFLTTAADDFEANQLLCESLDSWKKVTSPVLKVPSLASISIKPVTKLELPSLKLLAMCADATNKSLKVNGEFAVRKSFKVLEC